MPFGQKDAPVRVILDTNIVVSGFLWRSFPRQLLDLARANAITIYTSGALLDELADVLSRNKLAAKLQEQRVTPAFLMRHYGMLAKVVTPAIIGRVVPNDADDDAVIACALAAKVKFIVSGDAHLLTLGQHQGISIVTAAQAVNLVTGQ